MDSYYTIKTKPSTHLATKTYISEIPPVQCLKYDDDSNFLAAGCNGKIVILTSARMHTLPCTDSITSLCWKPKFSSKTKNVIIASGSEGTITQWHTTSRKQLHELTSPSEVFAIDYHKSMPFFASGGKDGIIRLYDDITKSLISEFEQKHTSRVFCAKFLTQDPNVIISGGWDCTIQIWDIRTRESVRNIMGPNICGDAIDIRGDEVLAGSWRSEKALQVFSYQSGELIKNLAGECHTWVYSAKFLGENGCIAAGGNNNALVVFENDEEIGCVSGFPQPIFAAEATKNTKVIAVGCGDGSIVLFNKTAND